MSTDSSFTSLNFSSYSKLKNNDKALISETYFTPTFYLKIFGYQVYHTYHPNGTAIYIKNNLSHHPLAPYSKPYLQDSTVIINFDKIVPAAISEIYCPPEPKITDVEFSTFFSAIG